MVEVVESIYERGMRKARQEGERKGVRKGRQKGRQEGMRNLLCRLAAKRFSAKTAERLAALLECIDDTEHLENIGELLLSVRTGPQLLKRIEGSTT